MTTAAPTRRNERLGAKQKESPADPALEYSKAEGWRRRAPLLPALVFTILVTQIPFLLTIWYSLRNWNLLRPDSDQFVFLKNYADIFLNSTFRGAAFNSILITLSCVFVAMILGIFLAILLDRSFRGRSIVRTLLITPFLAVPHHAGCFSHPVERFDAQPKLRPSQLGDLASRYSRRGMDVKVSGDFNPDCLGLAVDALHDAFGPRRIARHNLRMCWKLHRLMDPDGGKISPSSHCRNCVATLNWACCSVRFT